MLYWSNIIKKHKLWSGFLQKVRHVFNCNCNVVIFCCLTVIQLSDKQAHKCDILKLKRTQITINHYTIRIISSIRDNLYKGQVLITILLRWAALITNKHPPNTQQGVHNQRSRGAANSRSAICNRSRELTIYKVCSAICK